MTCIIVDDNSIARTTLSQLAGRVENLEVLAEFSNAVEAYNYLQNHEVDLILLDIEMPDMSGIELTRHLKDKDVIIVFTTSKKDYAVDAFELNVADFILKPVTPARFIQAIDKARNIFESKKEEVRVIDDKFIFIKDSGIVRRLKVEDILYAEAMGDYVKLHTLNKVYAVHTTFKAAQEKLPASKFVRIHRSFIVALNKIDSLQEGGVVIDGKYIPVADAYRKTLNKRINIF